MVDAPALSDTQLGLVVGRAQVKTHAELCVDCPQSAPLGFTRMAPLAQHARSGKPPTRTDLLPRVTAVRFNNAS